MNAQPTPAQNNPSTRPSIPAVAVIRGDPARDAAAMLVALGATIITVGSHGDPLSPWDLS